MNIKPPGVPVCNAIHNGRPCRAWKDLTRTQVRLQRAAYANLAEQAVILLCPEHLGLPRPEKTVDRSTTFGKRSAAARRNGQKSRSATGPWKVVLSGERRRMMEQTHA